MHDLRGPKSQITLLKSIVAQEGSLNQIEIDEEDISEFRSYYQITRKIADLDIGQTVVFKNGAVIAVDNGQFGFLRLTPF